MPSASGAALPFDVGTAVEEATAGGSIVRRGLYQSPLAKACNKHGNKRIEVASTWFAFAFGVVQP